MKIYENVDCMIGMKRYPDKFFDLAIVDPPYYKGINRRGYYGSAVSKRNVKRTNYDIIEKWEVPKKEYFDELLRVSKHYIVFGCNYFDYNFAPGRIVWDKCNGSSTYSDAEIAATDLHNSVRLFTFMWNGMIRAKSVEQGARANGRKKEQEKRIHVTQKPVEIYTWLLRNYAKPGQKILDTHVGSASSLIACHGAGMQYVGFELDEGIYKKSKERLENYKKQISIFDLVNGGAENDV